MQETKNLVSVFEKLNDLKSLFKFGEKIVPVIQSLIEFMKEVIPLLENINTSIADSTNKMPLAANQIHDVTNANELATTQILDLVDDISNALESIETALIREKERQTRIEELAIAISSEIKGNTALSVKFNELLEIVKDHEILNVVIPLIEAIREDSYKITLALQVQDITAQQLAAVNHLITSVHAKLSHLVADIESSDLQNEFGNRDFMTPVGAHYDPDASFTKTEGKQDAVDALVRENALNNSVI